MTAEQIRLYAVARVVAPAGDRIRTIAEKAGGGILYTIELAPIGEDRIKDHYGVRWFAVHNFSLSALTDGQLAGELRRAFAPRVALDPRA